MEKEIRVVIPSYSFRSEHDPNNQKNRIPTDAELFGLRKLAEAQSRLVKNLKDEVKRAELEHEALLARYHQQIRELEGTQSQLHESKKTLDLMQEQCVALQAETQRLSGIIHPIRRYPSDLLQCIFEAACNSTEGREMIWKAMELSHVCQRWRSITLDTPRLWHYVDHKVGDTMEISEFWSCMASRMKTVPACIILRDFNENTKSGLEATCIAKIPNIEKLGIILDSPEDLDSLLSLPLLPPQREVALFSISCGAGEDESIDVIWDIRSLLEKHPIASSLHLEANCALLVEPSDRFASIVTLRLYCLTQVDILGILSLFTQLSELILGHVGIAVLATATQAVSTSLQHLVIDGIDSLGVFLPRISCPNLSAAHLVDTDSYDACMSFIQAHTSIVTLELDFDNDVISFLSSKASQLQSLCIEPSQIPAICDWRSTGATDPPFPCLRQITVSINDSNLAKDDFESIVRARCLPASHPDSRLPLPLAPLGCFSILSRPANDPDVSWKASEFYKRARNTTTKHEFWEGFENNHMTWG